jgi:hypothetical protein
MSLSIMVAAQLGLAPRWGGENKGAGDVHGAPDIKVFWFFSSEKNKSLLFLKKKKQKLLFPARRFQRYGTWPESDCKSASSRISQG